MNNQLKKEKKTSLHLLVEPEMKDEIIKFSQNGNFENISQAGRYII
ncbi:regulator, partial [Bacillus subtilis]